MNNFYHKLNLDYNMQELIDVADNYDSEFMDGFTDAKGNYITYASVGKVMGGVYDVRSMYLKDLPVDFRSLEIFKIAKDYWTSINFILRKWEKVSVKIYNYIIYSLCNFCIFT